MVESEEKYNEVVVDETVKDEEDLVASDTEATENAPSVDQCVKLIAELTARSQEHQRERLELLADIANLRKRMAAEREVLFLGGENNALQHVVTLVDDFDRAIKNNETVNDVDVLKDSFILLRDKFMKTLNDFGVDQIASTGEMFDADFHEAFATVEQNTFPGTEEAGVVYDTLEHGYMRGNKVIKHAKVVVVVEKKLQTD